MRRFPAPWTVAAIPGGFKVIDANKQSIAYVYGRETKADADIAHVLTIDEARRIASNIAKLKLEGKSHRYAFVPRCCRGVTAPAEEFC